MSTSHLDAWFVAEVLPLESALVSFLRRHRQADDAVDDLRQEVYVRIYESAAVRIPDSAARFIFTIARHLLVHQARRAKVVAIDTFTDLPASESLHDDLTPERHAAGRAELRQLQAALEASPARRREVVELRKIECLSQREVAQKMGITEDTVERQISKGMRALAAALLGDGVSAVVPLSIRRSHKSRTRWHRSRSRRRTGSRRDRDE